MKSRPTFVELEAVSRICCAYDRSEDGKHANGEPVIMGLALGQRIRDDFRLMPERTFSIETPLEGFPINVCFNQFSVEKDAGWSVLSVGYLTKGRLLDDVFSFAVPKEAIDLSRESVLEYLGRTGEILPMEHFIVPPASRVIPTNIIGMAHRGDVGEITLANFTFQRINIESKDSAFEADPVALLRSPLNVQKNLIKALY